MMSMALRLITEIALYMSRSYLTLIVTNEIFEKSF